MSRPLEITIEPYRKIVIHEVVEIAFTDLIDHMIHQTNSVGGSTIPMLPWCNGIAFQILPFNPNSEEIIKESLKGTIHYSSVTFAIKEVFEREIIRPSGTVTLLDQSANANFLALAETLKMARLHADRRMPEVR
ncbi:MAG: hypothetical protein OK441_00085 [Thaumarchaeota archaeon]|nr:hypothetical protein [Nitrososphaerota archaeon]